MPKETISKNLFFKKSFATHLGGSSSSLDSQEPRKTEEVSSNHEVDSSNGDSEAVPVGIKSVEVESHVVEEKVPPEPAEDDVVSVEDVPESPQNKPGKRKSSHKSSPDRPKVKRSRSCSRHLSPITFSPRRRSYSPSRLSSRKHMTSEVSAKLPITKPPKPHIVLKPPKSESRSCKVGACRSPPRSHNSFISKEKPIRGKRLDEGLRGQSMGTRAPRSPRDQKLNRPNKDGGSGRKTYGRSGPLSSHQYRGPGHHHNRPHPVHAQPHYPGHPMAGMFPGPPVHAMHPQQYSEHLSQSPLESGFVMPVHSPRRTPRHSESSSCGSPTAYAGMPYQGPTHSPYNSPPPTSPARMRDAYYHESSPVQVPIMHHPRFPHHSMSPYDSPPSAASPLNYGSRGEAHAQGLVPQQRYTSHQMMRNTPSMGPQVRKYTPNMDPQTMQPGNMVPQNMVPISQNMVQMQPEYLMQVSQQGQRAQQPANQAAQQMMLQQPANQAAQQMMLQQPANQAAQQMMLQQHMWQQQRMQQNMLQQQDPQQNQLYQNQMMAATQQNQMMAATQQNQMMAASQQNQQMIATQQMMANQLAHMQTMFTPEQMQQMQVMLCMQQPQMTQVLLQQQKQPPQQVQPNILMNPQMAQAMPAQEMMQQFPNAAMAQLARPGVQMQPGMEGMQNLQAMQQQFSFMNLAGQQQAFAQGVRNPGFMGPRFPPPMPPSSTPDIPRTTPIPLEDPAIITTIPNDPSFGGPGSAFVDHSEQAKLPSIPKPELPLRVSPHLAEPAEEETPVPKPSTVDPMSTLTTEQPKKNTPGIIHLPPAFPTEEEMLLSPDSTSGTPISMKKNYWQMRKKSSDESPTSVMTKNIFPDESPASVLTKNLLAETKMKDVAEKDESEASPPPAKEEARPAAPVLAETPKKSGQASKGKEPKQFCLSDFSALVSDTVTHNSKLPKTTMPSGVGSVEVIPSESMMRSGRLSVGKEAPRSAAHKESHWRAHDIREKEAGGAEQWRPKSRESKEKEFEKLNSWRDAKPDARDLAIAEDERRGALLKEAEAKGMSEGEQIAYALNKLKGASPQPKRPSESSVVGDDILEGIPRWYDDDDDDEINPFDLNI